MLASRNAGIVGHSQLPAQPFGVGRGFKGKAGDPFGRFPAPAFEKLPVGLVNEPPHGRR